MDDQKIYINILPFLLVLMKQLLKVVSKANDFGFELLWPLLTVDNANV